MDMELLVEQQRQLSSRIFKALDNCKKLAREKLNREAILTRIEMLDSNWEKYEEACRKTSLKEGDPRKGELATLFDLTEEKYMDNKTEMRLALAVYPPEAAARTDPVGAAGHSRQLPKIQLPQFSGSYADWATFRDLFSSLVIENRELSNVERLHYLKTGVSGDAAGLLRNIKTTEENFTRAWNLLLGRYENKRLLVRAQLSALDSLKPLTQESSAQLRTLSEGVTDALGALQDLGRPVSQWDDWIVFTTAQKLDSVSRRDWEKSLGSSVEPPTWEALQSFLTSRILTLESLESATGKAKPSSGPPRPASNTVKSHQASSSSTNCACCSSGHFVGHCPQFQGKTPEERREIVVAKKLCYNCLGGHRVNACKSTRRCQQCSGQHHTMLHGSAKFGDAAASVNTSATTTSIPDTGGSSQVRSTSALACSLPSIRQERTLVVLATAIVSIEDNAGRLIEARALLDQGSEMSIISCSLVQRLHLPKISTTVSVIGIGKRSTPASGKVVATMYSRLDHGRPYRVNALVLPSLTAYSPCKNVIRQSWPHIEGLKLADPHYDNDSSIDIVLGADVYAEVLQDGVRKGPAGSPIAQNTALGWILSGAVAGSN